MSHRCPIYFKGSSAKMMNDGPLEFKNGGKFQIFSTLAEMKAFSTGSEPMLAYCGEKEAVYAYCSDCTATSNDDTVTTTGAGGNTRWELLQKLSRNFGDTGWIEKDNATITKLSSTSVRLNLSGAGVLGIRSVRYELAAGNYDATISGAAGTKFAYFDDGSGTIKLKDSLWDFETQVPIFTVPWNGTAIIAQPTTELHGIRDIIWHLYQHRYFGVQFNSGLVPTYNAQTDNNVNPSDATSGFLWFTSGTIQDEDAIATPGTGQWLQTLGSGLTNTTAAVLPFLYYNNTVIVGVDPMADRAPFVHAGGTTFPQWNNGGTLQAAVSGDYVVYHYFSTPMVGGWSVFARPHNSVFSSLETANAASISSLYWEGLSEIKHTGSAVFRCGTGFTATEHRAKLVAYRDFRLTPGTPSLSTVTAHNSLAGLQSAATGVTWGHLTDQPQTIAGLKTLEGGAKIKQTTASLVASYVFYPAESSVARGSAVSCTSGQWRDVTSVTLTTGWYAVSGTICAVGTCTTAIIQGGMGTQTGNSGTGLTDGDGTVYGIFNLNTVDMQLGFAMRPFYVSAASQTIFLKIYFSNNGGSGTCNGYGTIRCMAISQ